MASRKYIKFGLRADKNLADLNNPTTAIDNCLDDLAFGSNVLGEKFTFSSGDILPLRSLITTDVKDTINTTTGLPKIFTDMEGSVLSYNADLVPGSLVNGIQSVQPQVTLQDHISRYKIVLGDPPFVGGGAGPLIDYVDPTRITNFCGDISNFEIELTPGTDSEKDIIVGNRYIILTVGSTISAAQWDQITGQNLSTSTGYSNGYIFTCVRTVGDVTSNADTDAIVRDISTPSGDFADVGDDTFQSSLQSNKVFTKINSSTHDSIFLEDSTWPRETTYGQTPTLEYEFNVHPSFNTDKGLIQINGYLGGTYEQIVKTNGLCVIEEDTLNNDTWTFIAGTNTDKIIPQGNIILSTVSRSFTEGTETVTRDVTEVIFENEEDWKKIGKNMGYTVIHTQSEPDPTPGSNQYIDVTYTLEGDIIETSAGSTGNKIVLSQNLAKTTVEDYNNPGTYNEVTLADFYNGNAVSQEAFASYVIGGDTIPEWRNINFTVPRGDFRTKVRYTIWWPDNPEVSNSDKVVFIQSPGNRGVDQEAYYPEQVDIEFLSQRFSYPYFRDNKASVMRQRGKTRIEVDTKFVNVYQRDVATSIVTQSNHAFPDLKSVFDGGSDSEIRRVKVRVFEGGRIRASERTSRDITREDNTTYTYNYTKYTDSLVGAEEGDHIILSKLNGSTREYYAFQVQYARPMDQIKYEGESSSRDHRRYVDVDQDIVSLTGITGSTLDNNSLVDAVIVKNKGLVGIYKHGSSGLEHLGNPLSNVSEGARSTRVSEVQPDNILYKIEPDSFDSTNTVNTVFDTHKYGFRVTSVGHENSILATTSTIGVQHHPKAPAGEQALTTTDGIAVVYASRGLEDNSTVEECTGVFGKEVAVNASVGTNIIVLKDVDGISAGQFVYFDGSIPYDTDNMTVVRSVNTGNNTIVLERSDDQSDALLTALLPIGVTVVFVPPTAGTNNNGWDKLNKEYCIVPLNTAPPWEGTTRGLESPALTAIRDYGVMAKELRFVELSFVLPDVNIQEFDSFNTDLEKYIPVEYVPPVTG